MKKTLNTKTLLRFQNWKSEWNVQNWDLLDYANFHGNIDLLISFIDLFYPDVIEHKGCIILKHNFDKDIFKQWEEKISSKNDIEYILNHIHIYDLFDNDNEEKDLKNLEYIAKMILKFWKFSLEERYPNKKFQFKYTSEPQDYGPTISFFQKKVYKKIEN